MLENLGRLADNSKLLAVLHCKGISNMLRQYNRPELPWAFHLESNSQGVAMYLCASSMYLTHYTVR